MAFTAEEKRVYYAQKRRKESIGKKAPPFLNQLRQRDEIAGKNRFKSEVFSQETLGCIFLGTPWQEAEELVRKSQTLVLEEEEESEESGSKKKGRKKKEKDDSFVPALNAILGITSGACETWEELVAEFDLWLDMRDQARKNLYWLTKTVLKKDLEPDVHQVICDQFVQKNFDGAFPDGPDR